MQAHGSSKWWNGEHCRHTVGLRRASCNRRCDEGDRWCCFCGRTVGRCWVTVMLSSPPRRCLGLPFLAKMMDLLMTTMDVGSRRRSLAVMRPISAGCRFAVGHAAGVVSHWVARFDGADSVGVPLRQRDRTHRLRSERALRRCQTHQSHWIVAKQLEACGGLSMACNPGANHC